MIHYEVIAGGVSVLMAWKAAVDFGVDLRSHDTERQFTTLAEAARLLISTQYISE